MNQPLQPSSRRFSLAATAQIASLMMLMMIAACGSVDADPPPGSCAGGTSGLPITFDRSGVAYLLTGFEGGEDSTLAVDPAGGPNMVGKVVRASVGPWFGGTTVSTCANRTIARMPFATGATTMKMRVYSPGAGMRVRMKVENASTPGITCETDAVTGGIGWETVTFNFANPGVSPPVTGSPTAALNVNETYDRVSVFFNVAAAGGNWAGTYYFDDIAFGTR